jgi:hypothetical protein
VVESFHPLDANTIEARVVLSAPPGQYATQVAGPFGASNTQLFEILPTVLGNGSELEVRDLQGREDPSSTAPNPFHSWVADGMMYVTDHLRSAVKAVDLSDGTVTTLAGRDDAFGNTDGPAARSRFGQPAGVWADSERVYIADRYYNTIRRISSATGEVSTLAGSADEAGSRDGDASLARFSGPVGIWGDGDRLFVSDSQNFTIRQIDLTTGEVATVAGAAGLRGGLDGTGASARFHAPVALWGDGTRLYVVDGGAVREIDLATRRVRTLSGHTTESGYADGMGRDARFSFAGGIWGDGTTLFVADSGNNSLRAISPDTGWVRTMSTSPENGQSASATGADSSFDAPVGVVGDGKAIYVLDSMRSGVRLLTAALGAEKARTHVAFASNGASRLTSLTSDGGMTFRSGYGRIVPDGNGAAPGGILVMSRGLADGRVAETAIAASAPVTQGRIYVEVRNAVNTGVAIANPNPTAATVNFYLSDGDGNLLHSGQTRIDGNGQVTAFLDQQPFAPSQTGDLPSARSFTFTSSVPVAVTALRGYTNQRSEFLMTTQVVAAIDAATTDPIAFPHFAAGGGFSTEIMLVNPTDAEISGTIVILGDAGTSNADETRTRSYRIAPRSSTRIEMSDAEAMVRTGWVRVLPDAGTTSPAGTLTFSHEVDGVRVSETSVTARPQASSFILYAEKEGGAESTRGASRTAFGIGNPGESVAAVRFELLTGEGAATGLEGRLDIPAGAHAAMFVDQVPGLENMPEGFRGFLRVSGPPLSLVGLRARENRHGEISMVEMPPVSDSNTTLSEERVFPHFTMGDGFTTQFILMGDRDAEQSGVLRFVSQSGEALPLPLR